MTKEEAREIQEELDRQGSRHDSLSEQIKYFVEWLPGTLLELFKINLNTRVRDKVTVYAQIQVLRQIVATPGFISQIDEEGLASEIIEFLRDLSEDDVYGFVCGDDPLEVRRHNVLPGCNNTACGSSKVGFNYLVSGGERGHGGKFCCHQCGSLFS